MRISINKLYFKGIPTGTTFPLRYGWKRSKIIEIMFHYDPFGLEYANAAIVAAHIPASLGFIAG